MTRAERHDQVCRLAAGLGLRADQANTNEWHVRGPDGYRGLLLYNQRSGVWKALGGGLSKAHFGELGGLLNLLACARAG